MGCANSKTIATISGGGKNKGIVDNANELLEISPPVGSPSTDNSTITRGSGGGSSGGSSGNNSTYRVDTINIMAAPSTATSGSKIDDDDDDDNDDDNDNDNDDDNDDNNNSQFFTPMSDNTFRTCYSHATASSIISTGKGRENAEPEKDGEEEEQQEEAGQGFNLFDDEEDIQADNVEDNDNGDISDDADDIDSPVASRQLSQFF